jgi:hypothetical protein
VTVIPNAGIKSEKRKACCLSSVGELLSSVGGVFPDIKVVKRVIEAKVDVIPILK